MFVLLMSFTSLDSKWLLSLQHGYNDIVESEALLQEKFQPLTLLFEYHPIDNTVKLLLYDIVRVRPVNAVFGLYSIAAA
jgi:hypothetical protein